MHDSNDALNIGALIIALRRHWVSVLLPLVLTVAAAATVTFTQTPTYSSTAEVAMEPVRDSDDAQLQDLILGTNVINTELRVLTSNTVTQRVIDALDLDIEPRALANKIDLDLLPGTRVVRMTVTDEDPQLAAVLANTLATEYFAYRRDRALDEIAAARTSLGQRAEALRADIEDLDREIRSSDISLTDSISEDDSPLLVQRATLLEQLGQLENQLSEIGAGADDLRGGGEILVPAETSATPVAPQPVRNLALAVALGLFLGVGLALLRDYLDDVVRTEEDVRRSADGRPVIGRVGAWEDDAADEKLITLVDPFAAASEEFQAMAANVRFALISRGRHVTGTREFAGRSIAVTSSSQGEGKTTTAANLAVAAAAAGRRVVLVGADLRKPTLAKRFGVPSGVGLTDLLADAHGKDGAEKIHEYLVDVGVARLRVLPAGTIPPNPTELLASGRMAWLHGALEDMADLIVYDTPPVLPVADTLELSQYVDLAFVVVRASKTHRRDLAHAIERLEGVGTEVGGIVLNGLEASRGGYGYGYGGYGYGYRPQAEYRPRSEEPTDEPEAEDKPKVSSAVTVRPKGSKAEASEQAAPAIEPPTSAEAAVKDSEEEDLDTWLFKNR